MQFRVVKLSNRMTINEERKVTVTQAVISVLHDCYQPVLVNK